MPRTGRPPKPEALRRRLWRLSLTLPEAALARLRADAARSGERLSQYLARIVAIRASRLRPGHDLDAVWLEQLRAVTVELNQQVARLHQADEDRRARVFDPDALDRLVHLLHIRIGQAPWPG